MQLRRLSVNNNTNKIKCEFDAEDFLLTGLVNAVLYCIQIVGKNVGKQ